MNAQEIRQQPPIDTIQNMINENALLSSKAYDYEKRLQFKDATIKTYIDESFYYEQKANKYKLFIKIFIAFSIAFFVCFAITAYRLDIEKAKVASLKSDLNAANAKLEMLSTQFTNVGDSQ